MILVFIQAILVICAGVGLFLLWRLAALLVIAVVVIRFRTSLRSPLTWFVVVLTVLVGGPLVYSITNYGTLFRLREMIYLGLLFTPLAVATAAPARARADGMS